MLSKLKRSIWLSPLKLIKRWPLRVLLVVPFVLEVTSIVGLVGYLSYRSGSQTISNLADQLMNQTAERVETSLDNFLQTPQRVLINSRLSLENGGVNYQDQTAIEQLFWQHIFAFNTLTDLTFASIDGRFTGVGRDHDGLISAVDSIITVRQEADKRQYYLMDNRGTPQRIVHTQPDWDTRDRGWYKQGLQQSPGTLGWTPIYAFKGLPVAAVRLVTPLYDGQTFIGVMGAGIFLSDLSLFLSELDFSPQGQVFIMERSGNLVATSTQEQTFIENINGQTLVPLAAMQSQDWLTRISAQMVIEGQHPDQGSLTTFRAKANKGDRFGQRYYLKTYAFQDAYGIDWLLVLTVPEDDFMGEIFQNLQRTLVLCGLALIVSVGLGIMTAHWISRPILRLKAATNAIDRDQFDLSLPPTRIVEIQYLNQGFTKMARRLKKAFEALAKSETELIAKVRERTQDLEQANSQLLFLSRTDALTQIANRGEFNRFLTQEIKRLQRSQQRIALLLLDIDYFKQYNDRYGHPQGDWCLIQIAQVLTQVAQRSMDQVARYGGEEFTVVLPESDLNGAIVIAERILNAVRQLKIPHESSMVSTTVSVSIGISVMQPSSEHGQIQSLTEKLIKQADTALYQAKKQGRDRYVLFSTG